MEKSTTRAVIYGLLGVLSMLVSSVGYLYGHKLLAPAPLQGVLTAFWQVLVSLILLSLAGAVGERLLGSVTASGLMRFGMTAAVGSIVLSLVILAVGASIGTSLLAIGAALLFVGILVFRAVPAWWKNLAELRVVLGGGYERLLALGALLVVIIALARALAPPTEFDALVYHLSIPLAYLQHGRITYLPDIMFWGMPQLVELLYLPLISVAAVEAAPVFMLMIGIIALLTLLGYVRSILSNAAAWTAVAALVFAENLARSLSTAYVDWMAMLFGVCALISLQNWLATRDRKMLLLTGVFCGGALSTKYTAGILLLGVFVTLILVQRGTTIREVISSLFVVGLVSLVVTSPWWIKNLLGTGNPFYPFLVPTAGMDANRLEFYVKAPPWEDWRAVILLPWQATFWGIDGKVGFSASIGALLVGLSPLAWMNWRGRTDAQKLAILAAAMITITGLLIWGIGSRTSRLLIQSRLYFVMFPAWAVLAAAGFDAIQGLRSQTVRFGRLLTILIIAMLGMSVFSLATEFFSRGAPSYIFRLEDERSYLYRNMGAYAAAMDAVRDLPVSSHVLMLWETRGYYCQPRCNSDEVIDRWYDDVHLYGNSHSILQAWHAQGYTDLLLFNLGRDFVQTYDYPEEQKMHWSVLDATLATLTVEKQIADGAYTLFKIP